MNRVLNFVVVAATALIIANSKADAAVVNITEGSTSGYTMTDGNTYVVQNSVAFSNTTAGGSGMSIADNATVVLYVPAGVTLTAIGAHGSGRIGGGAGIRVPESATLVITGEGTVNAAGGNAGDGEKGVNGGNAIVKLGDYPTTVVGKGSSGGAGGGGGGAGIGGSGGQGGDGGVGVIRTKTDMSGNTGGAGSAGETMGGVFIIGTVIVSPTAGNSGGVGQKGNAGEVAFYSNSYYFGGGGGGGGGGAGAAPAFSIGGGGSGGGGGGSGREGYQGSAYSSAEARSRLHGEGGCGGESTAHAGEGAEKGSYRSGPGGEAGADGGKGVLSVSLTAQVNVEREKLSASTHSAAQYTVTLDANGGTFTSSVDPIVATLGCELLEDLPIPHKGVARFVGWSYNHDGSMMATSVYTMPSNTTLYAIWETLQPVFTPESGTVFGNSLSVSISCPAEGATIHYTTDGSEPTVDSPVYRRFRISGRTTVKAIAEEDGLLSDVVTAEYALGQCADPMITPTDRSSFEWAGQTVSIDWQGEDGVVRYTTDGSDPTNESPIYNGPFTINDTTIVKAKAFGDQFFDSAVVTANITRVWTDVAVPQIQAAKSFSGSKTKVMISCATEGATIYYTKDGSEPNSHSTKYTGPFYVTESCTIKACAGKYDYRNSAVATHSIEKIWGIGDTLGKPDHCFTTDGNNGAGWVKVDDTTAPNDEAMKSGVITHSQSSVLSTTVMGPGTLTFSWRTSCEDSGGQYDWDHAEFAVDGVVKLNRDGINSWEKKSVRIKGDGVHTITWTYKKDDVESDGDDAAYVAGYSWKSDYTETKTTEVPVPYAWLLQYDPEIVDEFDAYEAAAKATAANGHNKVWECYVAGISPTDIAAKFKAKIEMKDGNPVITWEPNLNADGAAVRIYKVYGSETLENGGDWQCPTNSLHRFFKVDVEMP